MYYREGRWFVPWFIDVELVNPKTGDKVKKRLDFRIDVTSSTPESWSTLAAKAFENSLPAMIKQAFEKAR
jgi:hypothetical protein